MLAPPSLSQLLLRRADRDCSHRLLCQVPDTQSLRFGFGKTVDEPEEYRPLFLGRILPPSAPPDKSTTKSASMDAGCWECTNLVFPKFAELPQEIQDKILDYAARNTLPVRLLNLQTRTTTAPGLGRVVVKDMLACIGIRKGMDMIAVLPDHADGTPWFVSPREGIPPHNIETHKLGHIYRKTELDKLLNEHFQNLVMQGDDSPYNETYMPTRAAFAPN